jgi:hypothetical protein
MELARVVVRIVDLQHSAMEILVVLMTNVNQVSASPMSALVVALHSTLSSVWDPTAQLIANAVKQLVSTTHVKLVTRPIVTYVMVFHAQLMKTVLPTLVSLGYANSVPQLMVRTVMEQCAQIVLNASLDHVMESVFSVAILLLHYVSLMLVVLILLVLLTPVLMMCVFHATSMRIAMESPVQPMLIVQA